jgi:hypothetical protein
VIEDSPPNVPAGPVPDEITELEQRSRRPTLPPEAVDSRMVALALSSMATTLEQIQALVSSVPDLAHAVRVLERQHEQTMSAIGEAKGAANLAGGMAGRALEEIEDVKEMVGNLARSVQGLEQASRSLYDSVFPPRGDSPSTPPDIELADIVPLRRGRGSMTGE